MNKSKNRPTKAFLLAGGLGTRLRPLTDSVPKCLLPINGKPLLQHWLDNLAAAKVDEVLINTHWLHEQVDGYIKTHPVPGMAVHTFFEPELLGSAGTLAANLEWAQDAGCILIIYADNYTDTSVSRLLEAHRGHALPFTLGVFRAARPERCGIVEIDNQGVVTSFIEKPERPKSDLAAGGMYVADPSILERIGALGVNHAKPFDLGFHVLPTLVQAMKVYPVSKNFIDVGTMENYETACRMAF